MPFNLVVSNKPSPLNKKLIKFFDLNLLNLNKAALVFDFEVAHPSNIKSYKERNLTNFPVLVIPNQENVVGVEKIIDHLKRLVMAHNKKVKNKTTDDQVDDYWKQTLGNTKVNEAGQISPESDSDDEDGASANLQHKIQEAFEQRNSESKPANKPKNNVVRPVKGNSSAQQVTSKASLTETPAETLSNMRKAGGNAMDDELMAKFFENQEESPM